MRPYATSNAPLCNFECTLRQPCALRQPCCGQMHPQAAKGAADPGPRSAAARVMPAAQRPPRRDRAGRRPPDAETLTCAGCRGPPARAGSAARPAPPAPAQSPPPRARHATRVIARTCALPSRHQVLPQRCSSCPCPQQSKSPSCLCRSPARRPSWSFPNLLSPATTSCLHPHPLMPLRPVGLRAAQRLGLPDPNGRVSV